MIPNILTTARLVLVPIFAYLVLGTKNLPLAAVVFILSGVTDVIDGYIARRFHMITNFGKIYDPFVDKLMQITAIVCLALAEILPVWIIAIVICKEAAMIIIGGILYLKKIVVHSNWYGKAATVIFYATIFIMILWRNIPQGWTMAFLVILIISMLYSAGAYLVDTIRHYDEKRIS
ncbi:CDP-alcohol phosphatidyltransferase family protein [Ructibacterium gallinarum]|uniref:CDP-diacylglycerol--glycerol-3-phosphate 3-phosphatidyltransferase n=1 Tax=Ructibacterium gallinarum TaxID=2779355 RepID=A0A9D5M2T0_9FIRM|nr:CDP-alcohol phosphatidyltransferase family protein [Ructibacterium gallinarum]MBE5039629.1 CDP-alcohol phosphatidyltransferase family protein [Ructibacterium gallinarum]